MQEYTARKQLELRQFVQQCEEQYSMSSSEFLSYYRELESHGTEEQYEWYVALSFLGQH